MQFHGRATELPDARVSDIKTLRALAPFLWRYRGRVILALLFLIAAKAAGVAVPVFLKSIVDSLDNETHQSLALPLGFLVGYGLLRLSSSMFNELRDSVYARVRHGAMRTVSVQVLEHLHKLSLRYHLDRKTGGITRDMDRGTRAVSSLLNYMVFQIIPTLVEVIMIAGILLHQYSPWYAVITFGSVVIYIAFTFMITEWRMKYRVEMNRTDSLANTQAVDSLINYETVKYFGNERHEILRYNHSLTDWEEAAVKSQTSMSALNVGQSGITAVAATIIMVMAAQGVVKGEMSIGDLVMVNAFLLQLFMPLNFLGIVYSQLKHALADISQIFNILHTNPEIHDKSDAKPLDVGNGTIEFAHVAFQYESDRPILHDISFTVPAGKKVAVVGASGAGKSTLSRLLYRFYDVSEGAILINGQDVRDVSQESLRAAIGIVPQDTVLFNDTLDYNIRYARPDATREEIIHAAKQANIHSFIDNLPKGYDTIVGERGLKLSGGEKQRVAIARAILKSPRILIFDEATSSLDSHSEQVILDALRKVAANHTTLVIAHRLSTVMDADNILVMDAGDIVEQGNHEQLLSQHGHYAHLWKLQQEEDREQQLTEAS